MAKLDKVALIHSGYPPLMGGGLIEAELDDPDLILESGYPPLMGGGLIEGQIREQHGPDMDVYPPLMGGGLIEGLIRSMTLFIAMVVSAAHGRRPH